MKRVSPSLAIIGLASIVLGLTGSVVPQVAQAQVFSGIDSGLFHPRSSEQFFLEGLEQFETEVECLSDLERCGLTAEDILAVDEAIKNPQEGLAPQEQWLLEQFQTQQVPDLSVTEWHPYH
ncbi:MAG: hypothetical protein F6K30_17180 [Cyanothece sp. SIO2G6]|nr:hypothetical protein [Cyanothece sp. SIO2G6]